MNRYSVALSLMITAMLLACRPAQQVLPAVEQVSLPSGVFAPEGTAVAYHVGGKAGETLNAVRLPLAPLIERGVDDTGGYILFTHSNGRFRAIQHRQSGDALFAELPSDRTYIVARLSLGHLAISLNTLCRYTDKPTRPQRQIPIICQRILCAQEVFSEKQLREEFGAPRGSIGKAEVKLGGWIQPPPPGGYCDLCSQFAPSEILNRTPPTLECFSRISSVACEEGDLLLQADFEADTIGGPPSTSPAGPPPADSLVVSGDVVVVALPSSAGEAVQLTRSTQATQLDAIMGAGATASGAYCVNFTVSTTDLQDASARISFESAAGAKAFQLIVGYDQAELVSGNPSSLLPGDFSAGNRHTFRFDIDLDLQRFDVFLNGGLIHSGLPFVDPGFDVPTGLRFKYIPCLLECFQGRILVDDIVVRKTN